MSDLRHLVEFSRSIVCATDDCGCGGLSGISTVIIGPGSYSVAELLASIDEHQQRTVAASLVKGDSDEKTDPVREALRRLVLLKLGPRDERYEAEKPEAWRQAREALGWFTEGDGEQ